MLATMGNAQMMTSPSIIGGQPSNIFPANGFTNNLFVSNTLVGVALSATCPNKAKYVVFSAGSSGNYLTKPNGAGTPVTTSTVTNGTGWERNRAGMDINIAVSGTTAASVSPITYIGVASEAASNSIPYTCYAQKPQ